MMVAVLRTMT